jgi:hypothetical protein
VVMHACGTFQYFTVVPSEDKQSSPWPVLLAETIDEIGSEIHDARLVGHSPRLEITDGGPTPNPSASRPAVLRSRLTLVASAREGSTVSSASLYIDKDLMAILEPGDRLNLVRTECAGLGLSLLREGKLVFAVGAVSNVPLGDDVQSKRPQVLAQEAEMVFRRIDPEFRFRELPVQISIGGQSRLAFRGWLKLGDYDIWLEHGYLLGMPGKDECAAIALKGACGAVPASATAQLLNGSELEMVRW